MSHPRWCARCQDRPVTKTPSTVRDQFAVLLGVVAMTGFAMVLIGFGVLVGRHLWVPR